MSSYKFRKSRYQEKWKTWPQMTFDLGMWPLTSSTYDVSMLHQQPTFGSNWTSTFLMGQFYMFSLFYVTSDDLWPWYVTFDLINIGQSYIPSHLPSHVIIHIPELKISGQMKNLTSDDLWPWYVTFDLINIWRFPCYINNPHLVPIGLQLFKWPKLKLD
jgi:hypothetical protein